MDAMSWADIIHHDIACEVIGHVDDTRTYMTCMMVSKEWYGICQQNVDRMLVRIRYLELLLEHYPNKDWCWPNIACCHATGLSIKTIKSAPAEIWHSSTSLSFHADVTIDDIVNNMDLPWNWHGLSNNDNITFDDVISHPDLPWDWSSLSWNKNITLDIVMQNLGLPWSRSGLAANPNIPFEALLNDTINPQQCYVLVGDVAELSPTLGLGDQLHFMLSDTRANIQLIQNYPHVAWDYWCFSCNPNNTYEFVVSRPDIHWDWPLMSNSLRINFEDPNWVSWPWDYHNLSMNQYLTIDIVLANIHLGWEWPTLSECLHITIDDVKNNMALPWDWPGLSSNSYLTNGDMIRDNLHLSWDLPLLAKNRGTPCDLIITRPDIPWSWKDWSDNPNLTEGFVLDNLHQAWDWDNLSINSQVTYRVVWEAPDMPWNWELLSYGRKLFHKLYRQKIR